MRRGTLEGFLFIVSCLFVLAGCAPLRNLHGKLQLESTQPSPDPSQHLEQDSGQAGQVAARGDTRKPSGAFENETLLLYGGTSGAAACNLPQAASYAKILFTPMAGSLDADIICTGSVLNDKSVLTAAHCGGMNTFSGSGVFKVSCGCDAQAVQGGSYQKIGNLDAAVITFGALPAGCKPVALGSTKEIVTLNRDVLIAGYGVQPAKEAGQFAFGSASIKRLGSTEAPDHPLGQRLDMIVLQKDGFSEAGTCKGDSGAPYLFEVESGRFVQVGVHVGVLTDSVDSCPMLAEMMGHDTSSVMQFLTTAGIPFTRYPMLPVASASPKPISAPVLSPSPSVAPSPGALLQEKCTLSAFNLSGKPESLWRLFEGDGKESSCYNMCQISAMSQLPYAQQVSCSFGGREILRLNAGSGANEGAISVCAREIAGTGGFLRLRFSSDSERCAAEIQRGTCPSTSGTPLFSGSYQHIACAKTSLEPGWHTSCLSLKESDLGALNWEIHSAAMSRQACLQACASYKSAMDPKEAATTKLSCVFRSVVL